MLLAGMEHLLVFRFCVFNGRKLMIIFYVIDVELRVVFWARGPNDMCCGTWVTHTVQCTSDSHHLLPGSSAVVATASASVVAIVVV